MTRGSRRRTRRGLTRRKENPLFSGKKQRVSNLYPILVLRRRACATAFLADVHFRPVPTPLAARHYIRTRQNNHATTTHGDLHWTFGSAFAPTKVQLISWIILGVESNGTIALVEHNADENKPNNDLVHYGWT